jgi:hypothetical protein
MLNVWQSTPPAGPATGQQLTLVAPTAYSGSDAFYDLMYLTRPASSGILCVNPSLLPYNPLYTEMRI